MIITRSTVNRDRERYGRIRTGTGRGPKGLTEPAPLMADAVTYTTAARRLGVAESEMIRMCAAGEIESWQAPYLTAETRVNRPPLMWWVNHRALVDLIDARGARARGEEVENHSDGRTGRKRWDHEYAAGEKSAEPAALYGLLDLADARELGRRRARLAAALLDGPAPTAPVSVPADPAGRRAALIELDVRRQAARRTTVERPRVPAVKD